MRNVDPLGEFSKEEIGTALRTVRFQQTLKQQGKKEKPSGNQPEDKNEHLPTHAQYLDSNNNLVEEEDVAPGYHNPELEQEFGSLD